MIGTRYAYWAVFTLSVPFLLTPDSGAAYGADAQKEVINSIGMKLVLIPAGEFMMGSKETETELEKAFVCDEDLHHFFGPEYPRHKVRITKPFYLGAYPVTVGQFRRFVADTAYKTEADKEIYRNESGTAVQGWELDGGYAQEGVNWRSPGYPQTDEHPVVEVSWEDAVAFCQWLSAKEGKTYRLPTEAEWEYACRAGTDTRYYYGDDPEKMVEHGNVADRTLTEKYPRWRPDFGFPSAKPVSAKDGYATCAPVGRFKPNAWGLYDMHGNVWQWCADKVDLDYYKRSPANDPRGPSGEEEEFRVRRGGCFDSLAVFARSAAREWAPLYMASYHIGFRVARNP
jgi:formylglycine-generating enzyme required for sulfatase activity